jgi:hypothetical protein
MNMFATDRDLLVLEPNLFRDVGWLGQRLVQGTGSVSGTTLTVAGVDFAALGVTAGHVVVVDGASLEVIARLSATTLTVSRVRAEADGAVVPPAAGTGLAVVISTFRPQIALVHRQVLRMLGVAAAGEGTGAAGEIGEAQIVNAEEMRLVEAAGALHIVLASAAALAGPQSALGQRAEAFKRMFAAERGRVSARIDVDGDGVADAQRYLNAMQLFRG